LTETALTDLERAVLGSAVERAGEFAAQLAAQLDAAEVVLRTPSGVGFVTKLTVPETLVLADQQAVVDLPTVRGVHPHLPAGAEFVLQIKGGRLNSIEAFCYEGMWPGDESLFQLNTS